MGHRAKKAERCERCRLHRQYCLCPEMPSFDLRTRLCLVMHCREVKKPTATGPMALSVLKNSERHLHGALGDPLDLSPLFEKERRVLILFPEAGATPLDELCKKTDPRPITLVVPDGNWRQASRVPRRVKGLERAERVTLPTGPKTEWGIRRETRDQGLATYEAIARAMGYLESSAVQEEMEIYFRQMVKKTWLMRNGLEETETET